MKSTQPRPLVISRLSNGLRFSTKPTEFHRLPDSLNTSLLNLRPLNERYAKGKRNSSNMPVERQATPTENEVLETDSKVEQNNPATGGAVYRSLIPIDIDKKVDGPSTSRQSVKILSSASSLKSTVSSIFSLRSGSNKLLKVHLLDLPLELLDQIFGSLEQASLLQLLFVSKVVSFIAIRHLYFEPEFQSTYRFAQFVTTISHTQDLANYVKILDLSSITSGSRLGSTEVLAGWRDWKLRSEPLYSMSSASQSTHLFSTPNSLTTGSTLKNITSRLKGNSRKRANSESMRIGGDGRDHVYSMFSFSSTDISNPETSPNTSKGRRRRARSLATSSTSLVPTPEVSSSVVDLRKKSSNHHLSLHPTQSFLLRQHANSKDIPTGSLIHVFKCCTNLQVVDLSGLPLANDYFITVTEQYPPTALSGSIFVSDVARLHSWSEKEIKRATTEDIILALCSLRFLRKLYIKSATWLSNSLVVKLLDRAESVNSTSSMQTLDFRDSGLARGLDWAITGDPDTIKRALEAKF